MKEWPPVQLDEKITATPEGVVEECYRLISFPPGSEPNWDEFKSLFQEKAVLSLRVFPEDDSVTVMDLDEYTIIQMRPDMKKEGYSETVVREDWFKQGDFATCQVIFDMQFGDTPPVRCFDDFHLIKRDGRWWIVSIIGETRDIES